MVNVRKRGKAYEYSFDVAKIEGKRKRVSKSGFKTKVDAQEAGTVAYEEYIRTSVILKECQMSYVENQSNILSIKPANMIFTRDNGKYCGTDIIKYPYKIIHDELGIQNCRFYDLRGSYATTILRNGVEIRDVADVLGHKDIETTENYYISSTNENKKNASIVFDNLMSSETINNIIKYEMAY